MKMESSTTEPRPGYECEDEADIIFRPEEGTVEVGGKKIKLPEKFWWYFSTGIAIGGILAGMYFGIVS
jgi:hypothetical protein